MSKRITVPLRRENVSVSPCKNGIYLTFDAEKCRPIICRFSDVIAVRMPIWNAEYYNIGRYPLLDDLYLDLLKTKIPSGLLVPDYYDIDELNGLIKLYPYEKINTNYSYWLLSNDIRKMAIENNLKAIVVELDDRNFMGDSSKKGDVERFCLALKKIATDLNLMIIIFISTVHRWSKWYSVDKLIYLKYGDAYNEYLMAELAEFVKED